MHVYEALQTIPKGKVTTYKLLAEHLSIKSPRVVGNILHKNKDGKKYPCHRVVRSDGKIATGYAMGGSTAQRTKLEKEGVAFNKNGRINFEVSLHRFT